MCSSTSASKIGMAGNSNTVGGLRCDSSTPVSKYTSRATVPSNAPNCRWTYSAQSLENERNNRAQHPPMKCVTHWAERHMLDKLCAVNRIVATTLPYAMGLHTSPKECIQLACGSCAPRPPQRPRTTETMRARRGLCRHRPLAASHPSMPSSPMKALGGSNTERMPTIEHLPSYTR